MNRTRLFAILGGCLAVVAVAAVLYGMKGSAVHASAPPAVLDKLKLVDGAPAAPAIGFMDADGRPVTLDDFHGRYMLINLWATWCGPCITELPALARLKAQMPEDRFAVVPVDVLEKLDATKLGEFLNMHGAEGLPVYIDRDLKTQRGFVANELPLTILIDAEGHEIARAAGGQEWDAPDSVAYFKALSAPKPAQ
jgi:thiol-disulfide isomerase/thioredoxin